MKKTILILTLVSFTVFQSWAQNIWLNELHYDNAGTDEGEFIEVVLEDAGSYNLADFTITLYNGNNGGSYDTKTLDQFTAGTVSENFTFLYYDYPSNGIQNGESDGVAISYQGTLITGQFLSYEGTLTATDGPANGLTSTDIGVSEISAEVGSSLQLSGTGNAYGDFVWQEPAPETEGNLNNDQTFGTFVPDPEPTNYPANFSATAEGMNITLNWTDSDGEQLPSGYLILGDQLITKGANYTTPVDGTPVEDDYDWSDYQIAANVDFGVETFTIPVAPNANYIFAIFPYTNAGVNIDYKTDGTPPEEGVVSNNFVIINNESFANDLGTWSQYSVVGDQIWVYEPLYGVPPGCASISGYSGGAKDNEDWLISPIMDWTNFESLYFGFYSAANYSGPALQLLISQDYDGESNPNDYTWEDITDQYTWAETGFIFVESGFADLTSYAGEKISLAFKYTSNTGGAASWEVDELTVFGDLGTGIGEKSVDQISIYPNPATDVVTLVTESKGKLNLLNLTGQVLKSVDIENTNNLIDVSNLNQGVYIIHFVNENGQSSTGKLIVR